MLQKVLDEDICFIHGSSCQRLKLIYKLQAFKPFNAPISSYIKRLIHINSVIMFFKDWVYTTSGPLSTHQTAAALFFKPFQAQFVQNYTGNQKNCFKLILSSDSEALMSREINYKEVIFCKINSYFDDHAHIAEIPQTI